MNKLSKTIANSINRITGNQSGHIVVSKLIQSGEPCGHLGCGGDNQCEKCGRTGTRGEVVINILDKEI